MTNIIATVLITLITNVVVTDNSVSSSLNYNLGGFPEFYPIIKQATEQYLTTNVTERTTITVPLADGPHTFTVDKAISSVTAILRKLPEKWESAGVRTNDATTTRQIKIYDGWTTTNKVWLNTITNFGQSK